MSSYVPSCQHCALGALTFRKDCSGCQERLRRYAALQAGLPVGRFEAKLRPSEPATMAICPLCGRAVTEGPCTGHPHNGG